MYEAESSLQLDFLFFNFFFSQGIGFLGLASCTRSPSDVPAREGPVTQAELFAAVPPRFQGTKDQLWGGFF